MNKYKNKSSKKCSRKIIHHSKRKTGGTKDGQKLKKKC